MRLLPLLIGFLALAAGPGRPAGGEPPALPAPVGLVLHHNGSRVTPVWRNTGPFLPDWEIERRSGTGPYHRVARLSHEEWQTGRWTDTLPDRDGSYTYRVRAVGGGTVSPYSNDATVTVIAAPRPLRARVLRRAVELTWRDRSSLESGYRLERRTGRGGWRQIALLDPDTTRFRDPDVKPGGSYVYQVTAFRGPARAHSDLLPVYVR